MATFLLTGSALAVVSIDTTSNAVVDTIAVESAPAELAITPDGAYAVVTSQYDAISIIDTATGTASTATLPAAAGMAPPPR